MWKIAVFDQLPEGGCLVERSLLISHPMDPRTRMSILHPCVCCSHSELTAPLFCIAGQSLTSHFALLDFLHLFSATSWALSSTMSFSSAARSAGRALHTQAQRCTLRISFQSAQQMRQLLSSAPFTATPLAATLFGSSVTATAGGSAVGSAAPPRQGSRPLTTTAAVRPAPGTNVSLLCITFGQYQEGQTWRQLPSMYSERSSHCLVMLAICYVLNSPPLLLLHAQATMIRKSPCTSVVSCSPSPLARTA
jgi:hypothetical protein